MEKMREPGPDAAHAWCAALDALSDWRVKRDPVISSLTDALPSMANDVAQINFTARNVCDLMREYMAWDNGVTEQKKVPVIESVQMLGQMPYVKFRRSLFSGARIRFVGQPVPQHSGPPSKVAINAFQGFRTANNTTMGSQTREGVPLVGHLFRLHYNKLMPHRKLMLRDSRSTNCVLSSTLPFAIDLDKLAVKNGMTSVQQNDSFPGVILEHYYSPAAAESERVVNTLCLHNITNLSCLVFASGSIIIMGLIDDQQDTVYEWFIARLPKWGACRRMTGGTGRSEKQVLKDMKDWLIAEVQAGRADIDVGKIRNAGRMQIMNLWAQHQKKISNAQ